MLTALQTAISTLLAERLPLLFAGGAAVGLAFTEAQFTVDPVSADPVAGEPGPEDAVDLLPLDPAAPAGPHTLARPPYAGPRRVYLRSPAGDTVPLLPAELQWQAGEPARFVLVPRAGRDLSGFTQLQVLYGVVAASTAMKTHHSATLRLTAADAAQAGAAQALVLAVLSLHREALRSAAAFDHQSGRYRCQGQLKSLHFSAGDSPAALQRSLAVQAEIELRLSRALDADEGLPISQILSAGRPPLGQPGGRPVSIDPSVQS